MLVPNEIVQQITQTKHQYCERNINPLRNLEPNGPSQLQKHQPCQKQNIAIIGIDKFPDGVGHLERDEQKQ